jgi:hypothetical protein
MSIEKMKMIIVEILRLSAVIKINMCAVISFEYHCSARCRNVDSQMPIKKMSEFRVPAGISFF